MTYNGGFSPGHSPAEVFLRGTANLGAANTLFIELGGFTPGGQFDRLSSTGTVNVDGTLDVSFINGFTPANGDSFEIIGASTVNGTFDTTNLPALPLGLEWNVVYEADAVRLDVFALATAVTDTALNAPAPNPNRSGIGTLDLTFDLPVNVAGVTSLTLFNHTTGMPVDISTAALSGNGSPIVTWNLAGLTLPDGRYTAEIIRSQVSHDRRRTAGEGVCDRVPRPFGRSQRGRCGELQRHGPAVAELRRDRRSALQRRRRGRGRERQLQRHRAVLPQLRSLPRPVDLRLRRCSGDGDVVPHHAGGQRRATRHHRQHTVPRHRPRRRVGRPAQRHRHR